MVRFRGHVEEREYHALDLTLLRRIWPFVRPYRSAFALCLASLFVSLSLEAVRPYLLQQVIYGPIADAIDGERGNAGNDVVGHRPRCVEVTLFGIHLERSHHKTGEHASAR